MKKLILIAFLFIYSFSFAQLTPVGPVATTTMNWFRDAGGRTWVNKGATLGWFQITDTLEVKRMIAAALSGSGTVTSITPGIGFTSHTPITSSGTLTVDTAHIRGGLVPYTGATGNVNLGTFNLSGFNLVATNNISANYIESNTGISANGNITGALFDVADVVYQTNIKHGSDGTHSGLQIVSDNTSGSVIIYGGNIYDNTGVAFKKEGSGAPPTGAAGGDLSGTYPNPTVNQVNGITKSYYDPTGSIQTQLNSKQASLGYTAENIANKKTTLTNSTTDYPSTSAVKSVTDANYTAIGLKQPRILPSFTPNNSGAIATGDSVQRALEKLQYQITTTAKPNALLGVFGDSIIASGYDPTSARVYQDVGFTIWAQLLSGSLFFQPKENNVTAVGGNTTGDMVLRLGAALAINAKVVIVMGGTNDPLTSATYTINNLNKIYNAFKANGAIVIPCTILAADFMTTGQNAVRATINAWILTQVSTTSYPVDTAPLLTNIATQLRDGTHPGKALAYSMGALIAPILKKICYNYNPADLLQIDNTFISNIDLAGTSGTKDSGIATGSVADSYHLAVNNLSSNPSVVASKTTDNSLNQQVITLSGNYTGSDGEISFYQNQTPTGLYGTDTVEGIIDFEVTSALTNVNTIYIQLALTTAIKTSGVYSLVSIDGTTSTPLAVGRYQMRTPPWTQGGDAVTNVLTGMSIKLNDAASSTAVAGAIKIHRIGVRKIPANVLFTGPEIETTHQIVNSYTN